MAYLLEKLLYSLISSCVGWYASTNSNASYVRKTTGSSSASSSSLLAWAYFESSYSLFTVVDGSFSKSTGLVFLSFSPA